MLILNCAQVGFQGLDQQVGPTSIMMDRYTIPQPSTRLLDFLDKN